MTSLGNRQEHESTRRRRPGPRARLGLHLALAATGVVTLGPGPLSPTAAALPRIKDDDVQATNAAVSRHHMRRTPRLSRKIESIYRVHRLKNGTIKFSHPGFDAYVRQDGSVRFSGHSVHWLDLGFTFDLTDALMRAKGQAPYVADKITFMKDTRPWRLGLRHAWFLRRARAFIEGLPQRLRRVWYDQKTTVRHKKQALFDLWDECLDRDGTNLADMAQIARRIIVSFIRRHLPKNSANAYRSMELSLLNRHRNSKPVFSPYEHRSVLRKSRSYRSRADAIGHGDPNRPDHATRTPGTPAGTAGLSASSAARTNPDLPASKGIDMRVPVPRSTPRPRPRPSNQ
ncbi:MAG: hypothetical protein J7M25_02015 [Deltaproteobacteria bacterium]|nr:hypothetical protein [Deltaproteobacteria bacterium]